MTDHPSCPNMAKLVPNFISALSLFAILASPFMVSCNDSGGYEHNGDQSGTVAEITLARLSELCRLAPFESEEELVVKGYVTSSDADFNFSGSLFIESEGTCAEVMTGITLSSCIYPVGMLLRINLKGCYAAINDNLLQIGLPPLLDGDTTPDKFRHQAVADLYIERCEAGNPIEPTTTTIADVSESMVGRLMCIEELEHAPLQECNTTFAGYHRFTDSEGAEIWSSIREASNMSEAPTPHRLRSLTGILLHEKVGGKRGFTIRPRNQNDIISY